MATRVKIFIVFIQLTFNSVRADHAMGNTRMYRLTMAKTGQTRVYVNKFQRVRDTSEKYPVVGTFPPEAATPIKLT